MKVFQVGRCYAVLQLPQRAGFGVRCFCALRLLLFGANLEEGAGVCILPGGSVD